MTPTIERSLLGVNAVLTGALLGVLQWGVFFLLQSYLASTAIVYLVATVVWLAGSALGLSLGGRDREPLWLAAAIASYYLLRFGAARHLYDLGALPFLLVPVAVMGAYAGRFFRARAGRFASAKWLFFLENTGFVGGMLATVVALFWTGEAALAGAPALLAPPVLLTALVASRRPAAVQ